MNDVREEWMNERIGIMHFDGRVPIQEAERRAAMEWSNLVDRATRKHYADRKKTNVSK